MRFGLSKLVLFSRVKHRFSLISLYVVFQPSGLSGSSAPPPLIRGTIASSKGSPQVNTLISHMHIICLKAQLHYSWCHFSRCFFFTFSSLNQILTGRSSGTVIPPPLVRGGQQISSKHGSQIIMPPLVRGAQVSHGKTHPCQVNYSLKVFRGSAVLKRQTIGKRLYLNVGLMFSLCASLSFCVFFALVLFDVLSSSSATFVSVLPVSLSWLAHLCVSTADSGSPPAAAAAAGCLWRLGVWSSSSAVGSPELWRPGPERNDPTRPHQSRQHAG